MEVITRARAKAVGSKRYFTGKACSRGHIAERSTPGGRCVECNKVLCAKWAPRNRQHLNNYHRRYYFEKIRARRKEPEFAMKRRAEQAAWRADNPDYKRTWRAENREKNKAIVSRRRAKLRQVNGNHTAEDLKEIYRLQGGKCAYCRQSLRGEYQVDHILPLAIGGSNDRANIQLLCRSVKGACNQAKNAAHPLDFARSLGLLL